MSDQYSRSGCDGQSHLAPHLIEHASENCQCEGKRCSKCGEVKCHGMFGRRGNRRSGLESQCRVCKRLKNVAWYQNNREKSLEHSKTWRQTNLEYARLYDQAYRQKHKEQYSSYRQSHREYYRTYYHAHKEHDSERRDAYYQFHRGYILARRKTRYLLFKENELDRTRRYYHSRFEFYKTYRKQHALQRRIHDANRRSRKSKAGGSFTAEQWHKLKAVYGNKCLGCGKKEPEIKLTPDHIIPISKGGTSDINNIQPLCLSCNNRKMTSVIDYRKGNTYG